MARQRFAPQHSLAGPMLFVPADDAAWDRERISRETHGTDGERLPDAESHPFWTYFYGETRYDLDASGAREYLDESKGPETWQIRPLTLRQRQRCDAMLRMGDIEGAQLHAFLRGTEALVSGASSESGVALAKALAKPKRDDDSVVAAVEAYAYGVVADVGSAVIRVSGDLTPREKKHSGSTAGVGSPTT